MKAKMRFSLKAGERIFINGAVLTVSQKVTLSLLNEARFLLESHVLQLSEATTPMRQLYFVVQSLLINPQEADKVMGAFQKLHESLHPVRDGRDDQAGAPRRRRIGGEEQDLRCAQGHQDAVRA